MTACIAIRHPVTVSSSQTNRCHLGPEAYPPRPAPLFLALLSDTAYIYPTVAVPTPGWLSDSAIPRVPSSASGTRNIGLLFRRKLDTWRNRLPTSPSPRL